MATEKRLIDANALIDEGYKVTMLDVFPNWLLMTDKTKEAVCKHGAYLKKIIMQLPTVDAVEVVRCKDCKHYMTIHCTCDGCCISDDWYCADGERKDND